MTDSTSLLPLMFGIAVCAAIIGWDLAKRKGLDQRRWAILCFLFSPAVIALAFKKPQHRTGETEEFQKRWASLAAYDPEIKEAVERLSALDPSAVEQFRLAYADVQTKASIPLIVADLEQRWAAGERFTLAANRLKTLDELRSSGRLDEQDYTAQRRHVLRAAKPKSQWSGWWWRAPFLVLVIFLLWPRGSSGSFPTCEARTTRELVRQAIEDAEDKRVRNTKLLALDEVRELSADLKQPLRFCAGLAALNSGERRIFWRLYQRGDNLFVQVSGN